MKVTLLSHKKGINFISTMVTCGTSFMAASTKKMHAVFPQHTMKRTFFMKDSVTLKKPDKLICKNKEENCAGDANKKQSKRSLVTCTCFPIQIKRFSNQLAPLIGAV